MDWPSTIAFDFETSGTLPEYALQPWRVKTGDAWATSLVTVTKEPKVVGGGLAPTKGMMRQFLEQALDEKRRILGWNTVFDIQWLLAYGFEKEVFAAKWLDGMLLWRHFYIEPEYETARGKRFSYGLKNAVAKFLPEHAGYEKDIDFHNPDPEVRKELHLYNVKDTLFTYRIAEMIWDALTEQQQRCALLEAASLPMVARANLEGMKIDMLAVHELQQALDDVVAEKMVLLRPLGVTEETVASPMKLASFLYDEMKYPVLKENKSKLTGKVTRSTDKEVLHELAFDHPVARTIKEVREARGNKVKFADNPLEAATYNGDGRARPQGIVFGTYSGRLTYASSMGGTGKGKRQTGFAIHQMKGIRSAFDTMYRSVVIAPPGYTIMEFDASGQEYRWMAIASGDTTMLTLCEPGEDAHSFMGARINEVDYQTLMRQQHDPDKAIKTLAKSMRQLGKVGNLSLQYRTSARKLRVVARVQYNIPMEMPQANLIRATYLKAYPRVPEYWARQINLTKKQGYVETFAGRRVRVEGDWDGSFGWSMASTSINYRIQGTGADQKYLALAVLKDYLVEIGAYFAWDLHDGIYLYVPDHRVDEAAHRIKDILDNLPYEKAWGFSPPIPMPFDCKYGGSWGTLREYDYGA